MKKPILLVVILIVFILNACKKETEQFNTASINDYAPFVVGKYITYQLDSLVFINFGTQQSIISYQVKQEVSAMITDNLGRPAFSITRYIRKRPIDPWIPDNTFMAISTGKALEFVENNMRFAKLQLPIKDGYTWKGNSFIDTYSLNSDVKYLDDWDYNYDSVNSPLKVGMYSFDSTLKVEQRDEVVGNPDDPASYSEKNYGSELYAKGIGLIYRRFLHQEYQPPTPGTLGNYAGYGVTLSIIDHN